MRYRNSLGAAVALFATLVLAGCQPGSLDPLAARDGVGASSQAIIGGSDVPSTDQWPYVVRLDLGGGMCTGTLIDPEVILTAAHCIEDFSGGRARFGTGPGNWIEDPDNGGDLDIALEDAVRHRAFAGFEQADVALIRLARPAPDIIEPAIMNIDPLPADFVGTQVTTVGFGNNIPPTGGDPSTGQGAGTMRQVTYSVDGVTAEHVIVGDMTENICQGDSGGPTFATIDGEERVIAVSSFGTFNCQGESHLARTDVYAQDFLLEVIAAWTGPCKQDGTCDPDQECEFVDPDCDICGFDGFCGTDCETIDLDCPLGGLAGDTCEDEYDCESRLCITAPDDERVKYCSQPCDPGSSAADQCDIPLSACAEHGDDGSVCVFSGPTPGTQGAECESNDDCLGACDTQHSMCVEACSSSDDCADGYVCRSLSGTKVCTTPKEDSCAVGGDASGWTWVLFALGLGALVLRRRANPRRQSGDRG